MPLTKRSLKAAVFKAKCRLFLCLGLIPILLVPLCFLSIDMIYIALCLFAALFIPFLIQFRKVLAIEVNHFILAKAELDDVADVTTTEAGETSTERYAFFRGYGRYRIDYPLRPKPGTYYLLIIDHCDEIQMIFSAKDYTPDLNCFTSSDGINYFPI